MKIILAFIFIFLHIFAPLLQCQQFNDSVNLDTQNVIGGENMDGQQNHIQIEEENLEFDDGVLPFDSEPEILEGAALDMPEMHSFSYYDHENKFNIEQEGPNPQPGQAPNQPQGPGQQPNQPQVPNPRGLPPGEFPPRHFPPFPPHRCVFCPYYIPVCHCPPWMRCVYIPRTCFSCPRFRCVYRFSA